MNAELLTVLLLLGAAIVMFAINRPRVDAVALIAMVALPFTGVITVNEAIAGFANPNIVLIGAMFVIGVWRGPIVAAPGPESWLLDGSSFEIDDAAGYGGAGYGGDGYGGDGYGGE